MLSFIAFFLYFLNIKRFGGQAVVEGVMLRNADFKAVSLRNINTNSIVVFKNEWKNIKSLNFMKNIFILRGIYQIINTLYNGYEALNKSIDFYYLNKYKNDDKNKQHISPSNSITFYIISMLVLALALVFGFHYVSIWFCKYILGFTSSVIINLFDMLIKFLFVISYFLLLRLNKEVKRLFMYHGAEHKVVSAYENGVDIKSVLPEYINKNFSTLHIRCGTSLLILTLFLHMFFSLILSFFLDVSSFFYIFIKYLLGFLVLGVLYELITLKRKFLIVHIFLKLGLLVQYITTAEPSDDMVEVAMFAARALL